MRSPRSTPQAPQGPIFRQARLEDLDDPGPYAAVACLALHQVADLGAVLDASVRLLRPAGRLLVIEYGWDRIDEAAACWYWRLLPPDADQAAGRFLWSCSQQWLRDRGRQRRSVRGLRTGVPGGDA